MFRLRPVLSLIALLSLACGVESSDLNTSGIRADYEITADESGELVIDAVFYSGLNQVDLEGGDRVSAEVDGHGVVMEETEYLSGQAGYRGDYSEAPSGAEIVVSLEREAEESAPDSSVTLPEAFDLDVAVTDDNFELTWDRGEDDIVIRVQGDCIEDYEIAGDDALGAAAVWMSELERTSEDACLLAVSVARIREGTVDGALAEDSTIVATQVRTVEVEG